MSTYIWSLPVRLFHWLLAIGFTFAYIFSDFDELQNWHFAFGALVGILILFRVLFGVIGPKYAHFRDFPIGVKHQIDFIRQFFSNTKFYAGHNPAASVVMLGIFLIGILCSISGFLLYSNENQMFLNTGLNEEFLEGSHEVIANTFLVLVCIHLAGLLADLFFHGKIQSMKSMFTGYKKINRENTKLTVFQKMYAVIWFIVPFVFFYYAYGLPVNQNNEKNNSGFIEQNKENEDNEEGEDSD